MVHNWKLTTDNSKQVHDESETVSKVDGGRSRDVNQFATSCESLGKQNQRRVQRPQKLGMGTRWLLVDGALET